MSWPEQCPLNLELFLECLQLLWMIVEAPARFHILERTGALVCFYALLLFFLRCALTLYLLLLAAPGDVIHGNLVFSATLAKPIASGKILLYKIEVADGDTQEKNVKELIVFAPVEPIVTPKDGEEAAPPTPPPARVTPCTGGESIEVNFPLVADLHGPSISPTYDELNEEVWFLSFFLSCYVWIDSFGAFHFFCRTHQ